MYKGPQRKFKRRSLKQRRQSKSLSEYGLQLQEKQKLRKLYGIREKKLKRYFKESSQKGGNFLSEFVKLLEARLDNVVFRLGFAVTRAQARQLVNHGHILVNQKKVSIPSFQVKTGDVISISPRSQDLPLFKHLKTSLKSHKVPSWLKLNLDALEGKVVTNPCFEDFQEPVDIPLVVEYYSR